MLKRRSFGQSLLAGGVVVGLLGLVLWHGLPVPEKFPPFALTAALAILGGAYELWRERAQSAPQP